MKTFLIIPFLLFSILFAQDDSSNWYLGLQLGAGHSYRTLDPINNDDIILFIVESRNQRETPITGLNGGLVVGRKLTKLLWVESGIQFSRLGEATHLDGDSLRLPDTNPPFNNPPNTNFHTIENVKSFDHFYYIDIPLLLKLYTNEGTFRGFFFGGASVNLLAKAQYVSTSISSDGTKNNSKSDLSLHTTFNTPVLSMIAGAGLSLNLNGKFSLEARITAQRNMNSIVDAPIRQQMFYLAGNVGLNMNL